MKWAFSPAAASSFATFRIVQQEDEHILRASLLGGLCMKDSLMSCAVPPGLAQPHHRASRQPLADVLPFQYLIEDGGTGTDPAVMLMGHRCYYEDGITLSSNSLIL